MLVVSVVGVRKRSGRGREGAAEEAELVAAEKDFGHGC